MIRIGLAALLLAGCSGSVDGPPPVNDPNRITIIPATATLYSERPTTFQINGGTGAYAAASGNDAVKAVMGTGAERNRVLITRNDNTLAPPAPGRVLVGVSSGNEIAFIEVFVTPDDCR